MTTSKEISKVRDPRYPFTAIVGSEDLKLALILNAVSPRVGGVLVRGEKGTAKSTIVRALAALLPAVEVVNGCRFSCDPAAPDPECPDGPHEVRTGAARPARLVELPVGASEDRLAGSLDIERALTEGVKAFEPGLLAAAHRGVLYVDEVNLLHDHLVDLLLDAAALGTCYVEREGVSVRHAARFLLVGTMNPEEGELRPQLLDRFGLTVEVRASREPSQRAEVVRRRLAFDAGPEGFAARWSEQERALAARIAEARARVADVVLPDAALRQIATVCAAFEVDGLRADLVTANAAIAHAAWQGRTAVTADDVREAARLALPHRRRRDPFDAPGLDESKLEDLLGQVPDEPDDDPDGPGPGGDGSGGDGTSEDGTSEDGSGGEDPGGDGSAEDGPGGNGPGGEGPRPAPPGAPDAGPGSAGAPSPDAPSPEAGTAAGPRPEAGTTRRDQAFDADPARPARLFTVPGIGAGAPGRRSRARTPLGRTTGARTPEGRPASLHLKATVGAAAPYQLGRGRSGPGLLLRREDLREAVREGREGNLVLFVVDASGSMAARQRMRAVKTAVLGLLLDAYQRRDKVGLVTFRGTRADLVLPPTSSVEAGAARLRDLPTGGRTPLAAGLLRAAEVLRVERLRDPARRPLVVLVTDGRATSGTVEDSHRAAGLLAGVTGVVVDCESGHVRLGLARSLADRMGAETVRLDELADLAGMIRERRAAA
ncbi:putative cobaltochelatase [Streptosporangium roseum]|uniref:Mg-protoporphyrin IX chelatase n=1 Tax=Streptosporangium roseum (strain ATCC 12428 / DSM 43021 / JCM 3005 / KCTC 9067 / NCIMB 10171 / NRRL 2505 / NI 9100) TaxID=479432 RepID=D2ATW5_STRRD|nr:putative cobaltochelatase [Streptosporangium roseum]ACZ88620.1 chelatase protein [Streptosporangium roseum DSM 43021]